MSSDTALWTATALPDELLVLIVEACDGLADSHRIATLRSLCLVSKRLVIAAQKCLYSRIELPNHFTLVYRTLADAPHLARLVRSVSVAASDILYNVLAVQCALINVCDIVHATRHETTCEEAWDTVLAHSSLVSLTLSQSSLLDLISKPPTRPSEPIMARTRHLVCTPWVRLQTSRIGQSNYPRQLESLDLHETTNCALTEDLLANCASTLTRLTLPFDEHVEEFDVTAAMLPNLQSLTLKGSFTQSSVRRVILRIVSLLRAFAALPSLVECSLCDSVAPSSNAQMASAHTGILLGPSTTSLCSVSTPGPQPLPQLNDLLLVAKRLLPALPQHTRHLSLTTSLVAAPDLASFVSTRRASRTSRRSASAAPLRATWPSSTGRLGLGTSFGSAASRSRRCSRARSSARCGGEGGNRVASER